MHELNDDGGPAFPVPANEPIHSGTTGMTLRDYFAAKAMQGLLAADTGCAMPAETVAELAYDQADAMLEARK
jgi:hypothetical protein